MNRGVLKKSIALAFLLFFLSVNSYSQKTTFGMDEKTKSSVAPTAAVWNILKRYALEFNCGEPRKNWFQIAKININDDKKYDLVAYPVENCIQGNNITNFFVFRGLGKNKFSLVLKVGGIGLSILKKKRNSFNQIEVNSFVGQKILTRHFLFRKKSYSLSSESYTD
jgi:hypothetical protein